MEGHGCPARCWPSDRRTRSVSSSSPFVPFLLPTFLPPALSSDMVVRPVQDLGSHTSQSADLIVCFCPFVEAHSSDQGDSGQCDGAPAQEREPRVPLQGNSQLTLKQLWLLKACISRLTSSACSCHQIQCSSCHEEHPSTVPINRQVRPTRS